jgi:hypothetical protein
MARGEQGSSTNAAPTTTLRLQNVAQSYGQSAGFMAAVDIGVFTAISKGAGTYEEVARAAVAIIVDPVDSGVVASLKAGGGRSV